MAAQLITLSRLLTEALERQEFEQLCFDTFRPVYDQFSDGMTAGRVRACCSITSAASA